MIGLACLVALTVSIGPAAWGADRPAARTKSRVWVVFFSSQDCPRCEGVKRLLTELRKQWPVKVKAFDIDREADYKLMLCLEAIHSNDRFSVPLVMAGETVLMGESQIEKDLPEMVKRLARSGGARLPYLGDYASTRTGGHTKKKLPPACDCKKDGRPPSLDDELNKVRGLLNKLF